MAFSPSQAPKITTCKYLALVCHTRQDNFLEMPAITVVSSTRPFNTAIQNGQQLEPRNPVTACGDNGLRIARGSAFERERLNGHETPDWCISIIPVHKYVDVAALLAQYPPFLHVILPEVLSGCLAHHCSSSIAGTRLTQ
jgi:hypothetical protein